MNSESLSDQKTAGSDGAFRKLVLWIAGSGIILICLWLVWTCATNPRIFFVTNTDGAPWIRYPMPPTAIAFAAQEAKTTFKRQFQLPNTPSIATLEWRALKRCNVRINGSTIAATNDASSNWKKVSRTDVAKQLHAGTNEVVIEAFSEDTPPMVSMLLKADNVVVVTTDHDWESSLDGATPRYAATSSERVAPGQGNLIAATDNLREAWIRCRFQILACLIVSLILFCAWQFAGAKFKQVFWSKPTLCLAIILGSWTILLLHNLKGFPMRVGYDVEGHLDYVAFIQKNHTLPRANEGWEMFQAPLYYIVSAALLNVARLSISDETGILLLRLLGFTVALANLWLVWLSLRLLFPNDRRKQFFGVVLAAFLPANVYLTHYTTNETFAAAFATGQLYLCLRILKSSGRPPIRLLIILGLVQALSLWSKATAVPMLAATTGILVLKQIKERDFSPFSTLRNIGTPLLLALTLGGFHYYRLWSQFGSPLVGNWDARVFAPWWQQPGFHDFSYFFSFGDALARPFYSGHNSFLDSLYSTLWGDGLCGGRIEILSRPPWDYQLMTVSFVLALIPSAIVLAGAMRMVIETLRRPTLEFLLLVGVAGVFAFSISYLTLQLTSYGQARAFYGLSALLPFSAAGAIGFDLLTSRGRLMRALTCIGAGTWILVTYATFWVHHDSAQAHLSSGASLQSAGHLPEAARHFHRALELEPTALWPNIAEAMELSAAGHEDQAIAGLRACTEKFPNDYTAFSLLAAHLSNTGHFEEAAVYARKAVTLAPEDIDALSVLSSALFSLGKYEESIAPARDLLSMTPQEALTRYNLGIALIKVQSYSEAQSHFELLARMQPRSAMVHYYLGDALAHTGKTEEAIHELEEAVRLQPGNQRSQALLNSLHHAGTKPAGT